MCSWPLCASHQRTVPSQLAETNVSPSGLKATRQTLSVWPRSTRALSNDAASHRCTVPSPHATAIAMSSGLRATSHAVPSQPASIWDGAPERESSYSNTPVRVATTNRLPCEDHASAVGAPPPREVSGSSRCAFSAEITCSGCASCCALVAAGNKANTPTMPTAKSQRVVFIAHLVQKGRSYSMLLTVRLVRSYLTATYGDVPSS